MASLIDRYVTDLVNYATENNQLEKFYEYAVLLTHESEDGVEGESMKQVSDEFASFLKLLSPIDAHAVLSKFIDIPISPEHLKLLDVKVFSAVPLTDVQRANIEKKLTEMFNKEISMTMKVDPSLIGGLRVIAGHIVLDNTIKKGLAEMKKSAYKSLHVME